MPAIYIDFTVPTPTPVGYSVFYKLVSDTTHTRYDSNNPPPYIINVAAGDYHGYVVAHCTDGGTSSQVNFALTVDPEAAPIFYVRESIVRHPLGESTHVECYPTDGTDTWSSETPTFSFYSNAAGTIPYDLTGRQRFLAFRETVTNVTNTTTTTIEEWHTQYLSGTAAQVETQYESSTFNCPTGSYTLYSRTRELIPNNTYVILG